VDIERRKRTNLSMDIAPLVDVVFLLLLFFIMTSRIVSEPAIEIRLPESKTAAMRTEDDVVISVTKEGRVFIEQRQTALEDIQSVLGAMTPAAENRSVRIKADKEVALGLVISVVDEVRRAGISRFNIVTERI
jgi:biopolymer transport protein ExbD